MAIVMQVKVFIKRKGKYLVLKKAKDVHQDHVGKWECPGGKVKEGESWDDAVKREVMEETSLSCKIIRELETLKLEKEGVATETHVFLVETQSDAVRISSEHSDFRWITLEQAKETDLIYKPFFLKYLEECT